MRKPFPRQDDWHYSEVDDYNNAKSDDDRRRMLLRFGYDKAHEEETKRLFPSRRQQIRRKTKQCYTLAKHYLNKYVQFVLQMEDVYKAVIITLGIFITIALAIREFF